MIIELFTDKAREAISDAAEIAKQYNNGQIEVAHLLAALLNEERHINLHLSDAAKDLLADEGYDPKFGARPLERVIQKEVENRVARAILNGTIRDGDEVEIDARDGKLVLEAVR